MDSFCIAKGDITKEFFQCNLQRFVIILYTFKQVLKKTGFQSKDFSAEFKILLFYLTRLHAYRQAGGNDRACTGPSDQIKIIAQPKVRVIIFFGGNQGSGYL